MYAPNMSGLVCPRHKSGYCHPSPSESCSSAPCQKKKILDRHQTRLVITRALEPQQVGDYLFECYTLIYPKLYERRAISSKLNLN